jgi:hypothetical protein
MVRSIVAPMADDKEDLEGAREYIDRERASRKEKEWKGKAEARRCVSDLGAIKMLCFNLGGLDREMIRKMSRGEMDGGNLRKVALSSNLSVV